MATLVLTIVGSILGGPIGGAIGAVVGQQIDQAIFAPPGRQGPRLNELAAQTSSYGTNIPKIYGTMRASGTVIWATDLKESSSTSGGKGQPSVTSYTYSCSFAVVISARNIQSIGRIWADGNLLRGAAGDWKTQTGFQLYLGDEIQGVDPTVASAIGMGQSPAYRGHAYAVFSDMPLANFGNRIPSLSFEVFADGGGVTLQKVITDLTGAGVVANCPTLFGGYAASGDSVRAAIETLTAAVPVRVWDDGVLVHVVEAAVTTDLVEANDLGTTSNRTPAQKMSTTRQSASLTPETLAIVYYDSGRDYQQGVQTARRSGGARKKTKLEFPVTYDPASARALVESRLSTTWTERVSAKIHLPWRYLAFNPGDDLIVPDSANVWRISAINFNKMVLECDLVRTVDIAPLTLAAASGQSVSQTDTPAGPTTLAVLDLPLLSDGAASQPVIVAAAAGAATQWRQAALTMSIDNGMSWTSAGSTASPAIIGTATTLLPFSGTTLIDATNSVTVRLLNSDMQLADATDDMLLGGANACMIAGEVLQFGNAIPLGNNLWVLSRLWRGRRGTEDRVGTHNIGDRFILLSSATLATLNVPTGVALLRVMAQGICDGNTPAESDAASPGLALRPPSPISLTAKRQTNGDLLLSWIRRSRDGWRWSDGVDAPLAEEQELYTLGISPQNAGLRSAQLTAPNFTYTAAQQALDKSAGATNAQITVSQIGTYQTSLPATLTLSLT